MELELVEQKKGPKLARAHGLSKWYGQVIGLNNVSVEIPKGITGLLGPNGAGKTTFLRIITGLITPSKGHVELLGTPVRNNYFLSPKIGYCPEHDSLFENLTGFQFLKAMLGLYGFNPKKSNELTQKALEAVQLTDVKDRKIRTYSKGMRQRIKIAQAIAHEPEVLILDEPLQGTDPLIRKHLMDMIKKICKEGKNAIVSSHVLHEVEGMTKNILLINNGRIVAEGNIYDIRNLIDKYPHSVHIKTRMNRRLAALVAKNSDVSEIKFLSDSIVVRTRKPDRFYSDLPKIVLDNGIEISEIFSPDDNLEAVFRYLVKR